MNRLGPASLPGSAVQFDKEKSSSERTQSSTQDEDDCTSIHEANGGGAQHPSSSPCKTTASAPQPEVVARTSSGTFLRSNFAPTPRRSSTTLFKLPEGNPSVTPSWQAKAKSSSSSGGGGSDDVSVAGTEAPAEDDKVPEWKKKLLKKKGSEASQPSEAELDPNIPAWKRAMLKKKREEADKARKEAEEAAALALGLDPDQLDDGKPKPEWMLKRLRKKNEPKETPGAADNSKSAEAKTEEPARSISSSAVPKPGATASQDDSKTDNAKKPEWMKKFESMAFNKEEEVLEVGGKQDPAVERTSNGVVVKFAAPPKTKTKRNDDSDDEDDGENGMSQSARGSSTRFSQSVPATSSIRATRSFSAAIPNTRPASGKLIGAQDDSDDDEDDVPNSQQQSSQNARTPTRPADSTDDSDDSEDKRPRAPARSTITDSRVTNMSDSSDDDERRPARPNQSQGRRSAHDSDDSEEERRPPRPNQSPVKRTTQEDSDDDERRPARPNPRKVDSDDDSEDERRPPPPTSPRHAQRRADSSDDSEDERRPARPHQSSPVSRPPQPKSPVKRRPSSSDDDSEEERRPPRPSTVNLSDDDSDDDSEDDDDKRPRRPAQSPTKSSSQQQHSDDDVGPAPVSPRPGQRGPAKRSEDDDSDSSWEMSKKRGTQSPVAGQADNLIEGDLNFLESGRRASVVPKDIDSFDGDDFSATTNDDDVVNLERAAAERKPRFATRAEMKASLASSEGKEVTVRANHSRSSLNFDMSQLDDDEFDFDVPDPKLKFPAVNGESGETKGEAAAAPADKPKKTKAKTGTKKKAAAATGDKPKKKKAATLVAADGTEKPKKKAANGTKKKKKPVSTDV